MLRAGRLTGPAANFILAELSHTKLLPECEQLSDRHAPMQHRPALDLLPCFPAQGNSPDPQLEAARRASVESSTRASFDNVHLAAAARASLDARTSMDRTYADQRSSFDTHCAFEKAAWLAMKLGDNSQSNQRFTIHQCACSVHCWAGEALLFHLIGCVAFVKAAF